MTEFTRNSSDMKPTFRARDLQAELERSLGFAIRSFRQLKSVNSLNFKAVRDADGFVFTVKCIPEWRRLGYDFIVRHLAELKGTLTPQRVFERECPPEFGGFHLVCLSWCEGTALFPDRLSREQLMVFLDDYLVFSRALQRTTGHVPPYPVVTWRADALAKCARGWGRLLLPRIEECGEGESAWRPELIRITHGDLHPGNFAFRDGRVSGFFDIEGLTRGYPAWDIVRYFTFSIDHLKFFERRRRRRTLDLFAEAVRHLPYSREEWIVSINATWLEQVYKKLDKPKVGLIQVLHLRLHARLYRELRKIVASEI